MLPHRAASAPDATAFVAKQRTAEIKQVAEKSREKLQKEAEKETLRKAWPVQRRKLYDIVQSQSFEVTCGGIILFNMVLVVFETDANASDGEPSIWITVMTNILLGVYTTELVTKLYVHRLDFFKEMWNVLDFVIVGMDLCFLFLSVLITLPSISILRVFRLVRLARAFKAVHAFKELHSLLRSCACALKAIFWGMVMMALTLTVWGVVAVQLIHPVNMEIVNSQRNGETHVYDGCDRCARAFSTVFDSVLTFWKQVVAGDSWGQLCEPIVEKEPLTFVFFILVFVTVALTMINCILAVVVEAGSAAAAADEHDRALTQEKAVMQAEERLIDLCQTLDADNSGALTIEEFTAGFNNNPAFKECLQVMNVTESDMAMIFNICDEDDSGDVDYREFVEQFRHMKHSSEQMLLHYVTDIRRVTTKIGHNLNLKSAVQNIISKDPNPLPEAKEVEQKADEAAGKDQQLPSAKSGAKGDLTALTGVSDALNSQKMGADSETPPASCRKEAAGDVMYQDKLERMFKASEHLISLVNDVAQQSKEQAGILYALAGKIDENMRSPPPVPKGVEGLPAALPAVGTRLTPRGLSQSGRPDRSDVVPIRDIVGRPGRGPAGTGGAAIGSGVESSPEDRSMLAHRSALPSQACCLRIA